MEMTLAPGQGCAGDQFTLTVEASGLLAARFTGDTTPPAGLTLTGAGPPWTADGLP